MLRASFFTIADQNDGYSLSKEMQSLRRGTALWWVAALCAVLLAGHLTPAHQNQKDASKTSSSLLLKLKSQDGSENWVENPMYSEALRGETVPVWMIPLLSGVIPLMCALACSAVYRVHGDLDAFACGMLCSAVIEASMTELLKVFTGYPRPNALRMCGMDIQKSLMCSSTNDEHLRSFPSGHTAMAFCTLGFLSLYLYGKLKPLSGLDSGRNARQITGDILEIGRANGGGKGGKASKHKEQSNSHAKAANKQMKKMLKLGLVASPVILALFIGVSRIRDRYHWPADVIMGMIIGVTAAVLSYLSFYNSPFDGMNSHLPRQLGLGAASS